MKKIYKLYSADHNVPVNVVKDSRAKKFIDLVIKLYSHKHIKDFDSSELLVWKSLIIDII